VKGRGIGRNVKGSVPGCQGIKDTMQENQKLLVDPAIKRSTFERRRETADCRYDLKNKVGTRNKRNGMLRASSRCTRIQLQGKGSRTKEG